MKMESLLFLVFRNRSRSAWFGSHEVLRLIKRRLLSSHQSFVELLTLILEAYLQLNTMRATLNQDTIELIERLKNESKERIRKV